MNESTLNATLQDYAVTSLFPHVVIISTNKTTTENQIALLTIVVFLEYVSHGCRKGRVIPAVAPHRQELAEPAFDIS